MTVEQLINRLKVLPQQATVVMCMDWDELPEKERPSEAQWEDDLQDATCAGPMAKHVYLINKHFK